LTPLETALDNGHTYIIATLLQYGAKIGDINSYNNEQKKHLLSELHKAERSQDKSIMEKIIEKNPAIKNIITQLEKDQQESLKTSVEPSLQSPRGLRMLSSVANMAQSFRFISNPQSPSSSSPRKPRTQLSQPFSPTTTRNGTLIDTDIGSDGVQSPSRTSHHNSGLPDSHQRLGSESPATSPKYPKLAKIANIFQRIDSKATYSRKSLGRTSYVENFDSIEQLQQLSDSSNEQSIPQEPNASVTNEQPLSPKKKTNTPKKSS
jgi:hypothetical protein